MSHSLYRCAKQFPMRKALETQPILRHRRCFADGNSPQGFLEEHPDRISSPGVWVGFVLHGLHVHFYSSRSHILTTTGSRLEDIRVDVSPGTVYKELCTFILGLQKEDRQLMKERIHNITWFRDEHNIALASEQIQRHYELLGFGDCLRRQKREMTSQDLTHATNWYTLYNRLDVSQILREVLQGRLTHLGKVSGVIPVHRRQKKREEKRGGDRYEFFLDFEQEVLKTSRTMEPQKVESFDELGKDLEAHSEEFVSAEQHQVGEKTLEN